MIQVYVEMIRAFMTREDEGQGMVEYALILALISVVAIALLTAIGGGLTGTLTTVSNAL